MEYRGTSDRCACGATNQKIEDFAFRCANDHAGNYQDQREQVWEENFLKGVVIPGTDGWVVLGFDPLTDMHRTYWRVRCQGGSDYVPRASDLLSQMTEEERKNFETECLKKNIIINRFD